MQFPSVLFPAFDRNLVGSRRCLCWPEPVHSACRLESLAGTTQTPIARRSIWSVSRHATACFCVRHFYCRVIVLSIGQMKCSFCHKSFQIQLLHFWQSRVFSGVFLTVALFCVSDHTEAANEIKAHWLETISMSEIPTWKAVHLQVAKQFTSMIFTRYLRSFMFNTVVTPDKSRLQLADAGLAHHSSTYFSPYYIDVLLGIYSRENNRIKVKSRIFSWFEWWILCLLVVSVVALHLSPPSCLHIPACVCFAHPCQKIKALWCPVTNSLREDLTDIKENLCWHLTKKCFGMLRSS